MAAELLASAANVLSDSGGAVHGIAFWGTPSVPASTTQKHAFGSSCLYAHLKSDGTPAPAEAPRLRVNADGAAEAVGEVRLSHFLEQQARFR